MDSFIGYTITMLVLMIPGYLYFNDGSKEPIDAIISSFWAVNIILCFIIGGMHLSEVG